MGEGAPGPTYENELPKQIGVASRIWPRPTSLAWRASTLSHPLEAAAGANEGLWRYQLRTINTTSKRNALRNVESASSSSDVGNAPTENSASATSMSACRLAMPEIPTQHQESTRILRPRHTERAVANPRLESFCRTPPAAPTDNLESQGPRKPRNIKPSAHRLRTTTADFRASTPCAKARMTRVWILPPRRVASANLGEASKRGLKAMAASLTMSA